MAAALASWAGGQNPAYKPPPAETNPPGGPSSARPLRGLRASDAPRPRRPARRLSAPASLVIERDPRLPCTGAGAPSPLRFGAAGHGSGSDRPVRRLIGAPTAPPLPCCAVTDRGFTVRGRRARPRPPRRPTPAA